MPDIPNAPASDRERGFLRCILLRGVFPHRKTKLSPLLEDYICRPFNQPAAAAGQSFRHRPCCRGLLIIPSVRKEPLAMDWERAFYCHEPQVKSALFSRIRLFNLAASDSADSPVSYSSTSFAVSEKDQMYLSIEAGHHLKYLTA